MAGGTGKTGAGSIGRRREWARRVGWLVAIWAASVAALAVVAYGLRFVARWTGLAA